MRLTCDLCIIRVWQTSGEADLVAIANNRNVWRDLHHRFPHPYTQADARSWLCLMHSTSEPTNWAIEVDGKVAGGIGVDLGEGVFACSAHFGYWLGEPYWGHGIGTVAVRAASEYALDHFRLARSGVEDGTFGPTETVTFNIRPTEFGLVGLPGRSIRVGAACRGSARSRGLSTKALRSGARAEPWAQSLRAGGSSLCAS